MGCQFSNKYFGQKLKLRIDICIDKVGHHFRNQNVSNIRKNQTVFDFEIGFESQIFAFLYSVAI